jgi:hypothetical protein
MGVTMNKRFLACIFGLVCSTSASAAVVEQLFEKADPVNWRLQTYTASTYDVVITFFTPSPCVNGSLSFPSNVSAEKARYWNTVTAAKLSRKRMNIIYNYDNVANTCTISSYWMSEP